MTTSKKISNFKFNRVKVFWVDIQSHSEWISISDIEQHGTADCIDEGYLWKKDKNKVWIFSSYSKNEDGSYDVGNVTCFPRGCVTKIERIK
jgi:hypothetical protein